MENLQVIQRIEKDCEEKGHGRKKWWAENLGVHQQSLSYWLHGHRRPRGYRVQQINNCFSIMNDKSEIEIRNDYLLDIYYDDRKINNKILAEEITKIMSVEIIDPRTLGFLSFMIMTRDISEFGAPYPLLQNRLGWLLEVSGKCPCFKPAKSKTMPLVDIGESHDEPKAIAYLKCIQTSLGKRWHVYDTDIKDIRGSFIGANISTNNKIS